MKDGPLNLGKETDQVIRTGKCSIRPPGSSNYNEGQ